MATIYNDTVFGGVSWSQDGTKIVFIGEVPEVSKYESFFKDPEEPKKEEKAGDEEKKKEEHW